MKKIVLILVLILNISASSETEFFNHKLINVSDGIKVDRATAWKIRKHKSFMYDDVTVSSDSKYIYMLQDNRISSWLLSPLKRVSYLDIPTDQFSKEQTYKIFVSNDKKTIFVWSKTQIKLYDLKTKKLIKKVDVETDDVAITSYGLITLRAEFYNEHNEQATLVKWNAKDLCIVQKYPLKTPFYDDSFDNYPLFTTIHIKID